MNKEKDLMQTYPFTSEDIDLITYALRQLNKNTVFKGTKDETADLLEYIERLKKENIIAQQGAKPNK